jgi:phytoene dehydrogenase-like protein
MDVSLTYEKLMPEIKQPLKILSQEKSSSAIVFYWGIKKEFKELGVHNILFSGNSEKEFNAIFKTKKQFNDPTIYINITSKQVKSDAPIHCENWFVMINSAINHEQKWDEELNHLKQHVVKKINKLLLGNEIISYPIIIGVVFAAFFSSLFNFFLSILNGLGQIKKLTLFNILFSVLLLILSVF